METEGRIALWDIVFQLKSEHHSNCIATHLTIATVQQHILQAPPTIVDGHCCISRDSALSESHTIRHVYLHATAFKSSIQIRNVFLLKLYKLFSPEQWVIFCFYFIVWVILSAYTAV